MPIRSTVRFPGESKSYRAARNKLLEAEAALRSKVESVAKLRRQLPLGGAPPTDYVFEEGAADIADRTMVRSVRLSALFPTGKTSLILYNFMYGPTMEAPCPMCTSMLDALNGNAHHITQSAGLAVVARSPIARIRDFARGRSWNRLRLLSSARNEYNRDYHGETKSGEQMPSLNVFVKNDGQVRHFYHTELLYAPAPKGIDHRHVDMLWPLWSALDLTPEGRGSEWYPALQYDRT